MNNVCCEIIQDLLPLYCDGVCSKESRQMILAHIQTCDRCREELRVMGLPVDAPENCGELDTAAAASRAWKKARRNVFRQGILLTVLLAAAAAAIFLGVHYVQTSGTEDAAGLMRQLEANTGAARIEPQDTARKGDYLAVSGCGEDGKWHLGVYRRDDVFPERWKLCGSLVGVQAGYLANWNYATPEGDTVLVCFGAELSGDICAYTFSNSGVTYTSTIEDGAVLDLFLIPEVYDSRTVLQPVYRP